MNTGMGADHRAQILRLADRISAQEMPYTDHDDVRKLCDVLEEILTHVLAGEPTWTDWLDGLIDYDTERLPHQLTVRGAIWVNAGRQEPCEAVIQLHGDTRGRVRLQFMDARGAWHWNASRFRMPAHWLYDFDLGQ